MVSLFSLVSVGLIFVSTFGYGLDPDVQKTLGGFATPAIIVTVLIYLDKNREEEMKEMKKKFETTDNKIEKVLVTSEKNQTSISLLLNLLTPKLDSKS